MEIIFGAFIVTLILAVVGHVLWIFYRFLFRLLLRLLGQSRGQPETDLIALDRRFFAYLFSAEGLRYWAYLGGIIAAAALILLLKDFIANLLAIRYVQLAGIAFVTALTYFGGWKLCDAPRQRILGTALMIIGAILLPVNFWYYQKYILMIDRQQAYLVGLICTAVYLFTAIRRSSLLFAYLSPLTFHASVLLILHKLDDELEIYVFLSALLAILYPLAADYLTGKRGSQFQAPLILTALAGLVFAVVAFLFLERLENVALPVYLFIAAALISNKIAQIKLEPRYLFLGIPIVILIYLKHLESFDLAHYWFGLFFAALALLTVGIGRILAAARPASPYTFYFQLLPLTLIIFALPVDITSYLYLADKLGSLSQLGRFFDSGRLSVDALRDTWQGVQIGIYYLSYFAVVSLVILASTGVTFLAAGILAVKTRSKLVGFYALTALFCCLTIGLLRFWHPLLHVDRYFLFYGGLTLFFGESLWLIERNVNRAGAPAEELAPFVPALYFYGILSLLLTYILTGVYFELDGERHFDYYLCTLTLLGLVLLALLKAFQGETLLKNLKFAAVALILSPLLINSFGHWAAYKFFMLLTLLAGLIFLVYGWQREDRAYLTLASLTILTEVIYAFITVQAGQVFIKLVLLLLGVMLILVGVYFRRKKISGTLLLCFLWALSAASIEAGAAQSGLQNNPQVQYLVKLIRANPNDRLIRARLAQYVKQTFPHPDPKALPELPPLIVPDRFQRSFLKDDLAAITGLRAIEGTLQLDAMRQQVILAEKPTLALAAVTPLRIASHDYPAMLQAQAAKGNLPEILEVERIIPADKMYLRFPDAASFFRFIEVFDNEVTPLLNLLTTSFRLEGVGALFEREFAPLAERHPPAPLQRGNGESPLERGRGVSSHSGMLRDLLHAAKLQGITVLIGDPALHAGTDLTLILEMESEAAAKTLGAQFKPALSEVEGVSLSKIYRRFVIVSNDRKALEQIGAIDAPLAAASDFLYLKSLHIPGPQGFCYLSEAFVQKLLSPEFRINDLRRYNCELNLLMLRQATLLYLAAGQPVASVSIENLLKTKYLPAAPVDLNDVPGQTSKVSETLEVSSSYRFDPATETWSHAKYGQIGHFTPLNDLAVNKIRKLEQTLYDGFRANYQAYFTRYVDPVGIGLSFEQNTMTLRTVILPLLNDPLYNSIIAALGRADEDAPPSRIAAQTPSTYIFSLLLRSSLLKNLFAQKDWLESAYPYFYREMQPFFGKQTVFGPELFVGIGDFSFGADYLAPRKPCPVTLKEFVFWPGELPVVLIQSLADAALGRAYLDRLFHGTPAETVKQSRLHTFDVLGNLKLYGATKNDLLLITPSVISLQELLSQKPGNPPPPAEFYHLTATLQPQALRQFRPHLFGLIQQQFHLSCQRSLATLQNLLELYLARYGNAPEDVQALIAFGQLSKAPFCPQNGIYTINGRKVVCRVHGDFDNYRETENMTADFFLNPFFDRVNRLCAQLQFTAEGIVSTVQIEFSGH